MFNTGEINGYMTSLRITEKIVMQSLVFQAERTALLPRHFV